MAPDSDVGPTEIEPAQRVGVGAIAEIKFLDEGVIETIRLGGAGDTATTATSVAPLTQAIVGAAEGVVCEVVVEGAVQRVGVARVVDPDQASLGRLQAIG